MIKINISGKLVGILEHLNDLGFQPLLVGGCVRDALLNIEPKDIDVEVIGCSIDQLETALKPFGDIDLIGKAFGILKIKGLDVDFSVPRKENKIGIGHKEFAISLEPMTAQEAATRRDFSFNALAFDPLTNELLDFFGGQVDINEQVIRHTSNQFNEDPLRVLRAMQFQSRFDFDIVSRTAKEMKKMSLSIWELAEERISEEFMKWAIKGNQPERIFDFIRDANLEWFLPELAILKNIEQDPIWHPCGSVENHTILCLKNIIKICQRENIIGEEKAILVFAILLHDIGKATTSARIFKEKHGRVVIASHGHERESGIMAIDILERIGIKASLIERIIPLIENHLTHVTIFHLEKESSQKSALLKLSRRLVPSSIKDLLFIVEADALGKFPHNETQEEMEIRVAGEINRVKKLSELINVIDKKRDSILMGRHLIEMGFKPGIIFGEILSKGEDAQDNLEFTNVEEAKEWVNINFKL